MTEQFAWGIFISVLVALLCFAFIVLVIWKFCTWVSAALDKSIAKEKKKSEDLKEKYKLEAIEEANKSLRSNSFYQESLNRIRMLHNLPEMPLYKTPKPMRYYKMIYFETRLDAVRILTMLQKILEFHGVATVADYYSISGEERWLYGDTKWGWTDLSDAHVSRVPAGYIISLGNPKLID